MISYNNENKNIDYEKKYTVVLLLFFLIYSFPIILADRFYIDDLGRALTGYTGWSTNGRPLAEMIMKLISFGEPLNDTSPLPLIIGLSVLSYCLAKYSGSIFDGQYRKSVVISAFVFICNPFLLESLSYKFDSLPMLLSVASVIAIFNIKGKESFSFIVAILLLISSMCFYQATIASFVSLTIIELISKRINLEDIISLIKSVSKRVLQLIISYILYSKVISPHFITGYYNIHHSEIIQLNHGGLEHFVQNVKAFMALMGDYFDSTPAFLTLAYVILFILSSALICKRAQGLSIINKYINFLIFNFSALALFILSFIHLCILENPVVSPRVLISFSPFLMFISLVISMAAKNQRLAFILIMPFIIFSCSYSYSYGNAMKSQKQFEYFIAGNIVSRLSSFDKIKTYSIIGAMPRSPISSLYAEKHKLFYRLIPVYLRGNWMWGGTFLSHFGLNAKQVDFTGKPQEICKYEILDRNSFFEIRSNSTLAYIVFQKNICK